MIQEVTDPRTCGDIIGTISHGCIKSGDIATKIGKSIEVATKYISDLKITGTLRKSHPVDRMESRIARYELNGDLLTFYHRQMSLIGDAVSDEERGDAARKVLRTTRTTSGSSSKGSAPDIRRTPGTEKRRNDGDERHTRRWGDEWLDDGPGRPRTAGIISRSTRSRRSSPARIWPRGMRDRRSSDCPGTGRCMCGKSSHRTLP